ncbi:carboxypeptidase-like regulatory domain-containing protein [Neolewinella lacunae]|uniref:Carboxypeptidase-like regulatory domain-containing protein n=1 Tax=Neolewinella lacunae TaxID=1517758 RepID=A0A923PK96_9BACT|nr:carboxypeptidase regulatory-like domain-containing protein [Neolewinella lacunae]MBC6993256.1 carboxypeptidase-like regulatory domain-containing protein [Neolewinella lacunae]MDN3635697.1 carboxypeptidase-like regulatory domain-containing protein [Neolewinella lacunae]
MLPIHPNYPQFAPNQVLSSSHLNQLFDYLEEQGRLTRTHLIGIGIVCGLRAELNPAGTGITISRGCGVSSAGHLLIWDEDEALEFFRPYSPPEDIDYTFFDLPDGEGTYPMWELTTDRNDDPDARALSRNFLTGANQVAGEGDEKVLLLLIECRVVDNRNCTPNNCDDKGRTVETAIRPVLIRRGDLEEIRRVLAAGNAGVAAYYSLFQDRAARLGLATLRPPRFNVPNTNPVTTRQVLETYRATLSATFLARVQVVLNAVYASLAPLLTDYTSNPFANRITGLSFLHDGRLLTGAHALGYQYWFDHLLTIINAYEELRSKAEELFSLCCPDDRIFPRHLVLHHFTAAGISDELRHLWVSSPVQNQQAEGRAELESLFDRLVALTRATELPLPPAPTGGGRDVFTAEEVREELRDRLRAATAERRVREIAGDNNRLSAASSEAQPLAVATANFQAIGAVRFAEFLGPAILAPAPTQPSLRQPIRITPSFLGKPLSEKAIPFYYDPAIVLEPWNYRLSRRGRAAENYGFDAVDWNGTDDFIRRPLVYDLEPRNFVRIEGAIGQHYLPVLREIRRQINEFRLPIDVVALRTGTLTDELEIEDFDVLFADLESQYQTWRARLLGRLAEVAVRFYDTKILGPKGEAPPFALRGFPRSPLLRRLTGYRYFGGTVGDFYEAHFDQHSSSAPFSTGLDGSYGVHLGVIHFLVQLENRLGSTLRILDFAEAEQALEELQGGGRLFGRLAALGLNDAQTGGAATSLKVDLEEYADQLDELITAGDLDALRALRLNVESRREDALQQQLLATFQRQHPGLQFKAGCELGGTFIVVYHGPENAGGGPRQTGRFRLTGVVLNDGEPVPGVNVAARGFSSGTTTDLDGRFSLFVTVLPVQLVFSYPGFPSQERWVMKEEKFLSIDLAEDGGDGTDENPIQGISEGTVVADFYLPYRCCGQGAPIHIFPPTPPEPPVPPLVARLEQSSCSRIDSNPTNAAQATVALATLQISGGTPPYFIEDSNGNRQAAPNAAFEVRAGVAFTVVDNQDQRVPITVSLFPPLNVQRTGEPRCLDGNRRYLQDFLVEGGKPPYRYQDARGNLQTLTSSQVASLEIPSGEGFVLRVEDAFGEACGQTIELPAFTCSTNPNPNDCGLPCGGIGTIHSSPLWTQRPAGEGVTYENLLFQVERLHLDISDTQRFALSADDLRSLNRNLQATIDREADINLNTYPQLMSGLVNNIMKFVDEVINREANLAGGQRALEFSTSATRNFDELTVSFFECFRFNFVVTVAYNELDKASSSQSDRKRTIEYSNDGARPDSVESFFPSHQRFSVDRCDRAAAPKPLCTGEVSGRITQRGEGGKRSFSVRASEDLAQIWFEFPLGEPGLSLTNPAEVEYRRDGIATRATALVVGDNGCFAITTSTVNV